MSDDLYVALAGELPNEVGISGSLITMVEPDVGFEHAYNRWYEDDHFYSGAMHGPWMFSGKRWVATRDLQLLRYPADSPIAQPVTTGCYISTYWMATGHYGDAVLWGKEAMSGHLYPAGRGFEQRQHVYTAFSEYDFGLVRPDLPAMLPHHSLDYPCAGMVVEVIEPDAGVDRSEVVRRLRDDVLPGELAGSAAISVLSFLPHAQGETNVPRVGSAPGAELNLTLLWFLQADPRTCWSMFAAHADSLRAAGGRVVFAAPFVPTIVGTDTYVDELR
jgi:hypothetical protein